MESENNVSPEKKDSILKSLAIAGFIAVLLIVAWLSIQLVQSFPAALNSLASLAEGVKGYQETVLDTDPELTPLTVTANTSLLNTNDTITINWSDVRAQGTYIFTYECVDGVAVTHNSEIGDRVIECDKNYNIGDVNTISLVMESEKNRYADVKYTISFLRTSEDTPRAQGKNVVTLVNTDINSQYTQESEDSNEIEGELTTEFEPTTPTTPTSPSAPTEEPEPTYTQEYVYAIPVSDPNGHIDLSTTFIDMGEIIENKFVVGPVSVKNAGAIQFSVRNIGTKTSNDWTYSVKLPNGETYVSEDQKALKPNERALITIGFPAGAKTPHTFVVEVDTTADKKNSNNEFSKRVTFAN